MNDFNNIDFKLSKLKDVKIFEDLIENYYKAHSLKSKKEPDLSYFFSKIQNRKDKKRLFSLIEDIKITYCLCYIDFALAGRISFNHFSKGRLKGGSILDDPQKFFGKLEHHRYLTSFIFRYRALWDKIMGFLILFYGNEKKYKIFDDAKSKKRNFNKQVKTITEIPEFFAQIGKLIEKFDKTFRTSEAHGISRLKKHSLSMNATGIKNPQIDISNYWNLLTFHMQELDKYIKKELA